MVKAFIFDIDNTIYDYDSNDVIAMRELCKFAEEKFNLDEDAFLKIYYESRKVVKTRLTEGAGQHNRMLFFQAAVEIIGKNPFDYVLEMYEIYWNTFLEGMKLYDGAEEFLKSLKESELKIALCTDMTAHIQYRKIKKLGISDLIDVIVTSEEAGFEKPSPLIFNLVLEKLKLKPSEAIYIGDHIDKDIKGALNCGMTPIWFTYNREFDDSAVDCLKFQSYRDLDLRSLIK